jgi:hypothetical protein
MTSNSEAIVEEFDYIKIKYFCTGKNITRKLKKCGGKFATHVTGNVLIPFIESFYNLIRKDDIRQIIQTERSIHS